MVPTPSHLSISLNIKENLDLLRAKPMRKRKLIVGEEAKRFSLVRRKIRTEIFSRSFFFFFNYLSAVKHVYYKGGTLLPQLLLGHDSSLNSASNSLYKIKGAWKRYFCLLLFLIRKLVSYTSITIY